jgi:indole-3-glycerol phosphate synthase
MSDFLQQMAEHSAERASHVGSLNVADLDRPVVPLQLSTFDVIAEIKGRSPAEGELAGADLDRSEQARQYAAGGACAISVLTARKAGASGVLLIATMLDEDTLRAMLDTAYEHEMFVLLECFDTTDLERVDTLLDYPPDADQAAAGTLLIGVNTRNLRTLEVDKNRLAQLAPQLPDARCVAESGLQKAADAAAAAASGYQLALVGTALMQSDDPASLITAMREAGTAGVTV